MERFAKESEKLVRGLDIEVLGAPLVVVFTDAAKAVADLRKDEVDFMLAVTISWVEAPNVTAVLKEFFHKPVLLWSHTMFREGGRLLTLGPLPGGAVIRETLEEMGAKFKFIWGMPDEPRVAQGIEKFSRAAYAVSRIARSRIGLLGYASMGMYTGTFDHVSIRRELGPEVDQIDQYELIRMLEKFDDTQANELVHKMRAEWDVLDGVTEEDLRKTARMYLSLKSMALNHAWDAVTVKCQYELSKSYGFSPCLALSMLGSELPCSCEGDVPLITTQLIMHYLTGKTTTYGDIHTVADNSVLLGACGFAPFDLTSSRPKVDKHTALYEGLLNSAQYKTGTVTLSRLASCKDGYRMHIAVGEADVAESFN